MPSRAKTIQERLKALKPASFAIAALFTHFHSEEERAPMSKLAYFFSLSRHSSIVLALVTTLMSVFMKKLQVMQALNDN